MTFCVFINIGGPVWLELVRLIRWSHKRDVSTRLSTKHVVCSVQVDGGHEAVRGCHEAVRGSCKSFKDKNNGSFKRTGFEPFQRSMLLFNHLMIHTF